MKNLLLILMIACSAGAMAANNKTPLPGNEKQEQFYGPVFGTEEGNNETEHDTLQSKKKQAPLATRLTGNGSRFDLSVYIVDFINRNNIKIAKRVLKD